MEKVAIIGSGISGLTCGYLLSKKHDVHMFEANDYIGGHTATIDVELNNKNYAIDTGFIVFNDRTYPNFEKLLSQINISPYPTEMSFSVHNELTALEYNGHSFSSLFAQKRNLFNPQFWRFLAEIIKFNRRCHQLYNSDTYPDINLGEFLNQQGFSTFFCEHYILPMGAAIWSASLDDAKAFSIKFFIQFFHHHGLLNIINRPQWYVLKDGSRSYIPELTAAFKHQIYLSTPVTSVKRENNQIQLQINQGEWQTFDKVIFACHSDQALSLLDTPTQDEQQVLSNLCYQKNDVVLHTDRKLLPTRRKAWASWNYRLDGNKTRPSSVTYNMNILQRLPANSPLFLVTLNQTEQINHNKIIRQFVYEHPVFNQQSQQAQQRKNDICGHNNTFYAGAYWHNGFHEDGVKSALNVCKKLGVSL